MLLAIDVGNTNIVFAVFDGEKLLGQWRLATDGRRTAEEYILALSQLMELENVPREKIRSAIISSVVPQTLFPLKILCRRYFQCEALVIGDEKVKLGLAIHVDRPTEVGADRLVNSVAAYDRYGSDVIVIDFGTATTFDVVNTEGDYVGGVIAPGINLSLDALRMAAAKLPDVAIDRPAKVIGTSTIGAMQSGMYWGYVGLIEGIVTRIRKEYGRAMKVVATGGLSPLFAKATPVIEILDTDLTMHGLRLIFERNKG